MFESAKIDKLRDGFREIPSPFGVICLPRTFGFCSGVRNAIKSLSDALRSNVSHRPIWLLGAMIHNPDVNQYFLESGVRILAPRVDWSELGDTVSPNDLFVIPAFGLPLEADRALREFVASPSCIVDATCPFVRRVWKAVEEAGAAGAAVLLHGKAGHQESEAILSRARHFAPRNVLLEHPGDLPPKECMEYPWVLVNQTTMLAEETEAVAEALRKAPGHSLSFHMADTLCPSTRQRQNAAKELCDSGCDCILVLGGVASSNTTELHRIAVAKLGKERVFFVENETNFSEKEFRHYLPDTKNWKCSPLSKLQVSRLGILAGASCPDTTIEQIIQKLETPKFP